ncbi:MAG: GAF domain-containing protein [Bacteroidales bacterium]
MDYKEKKRNRYSRIAGQLEDLLPKTNDRFARMATVIALLHHKMDGFFWTGYYFLKEGKLVVGPYQGPVACQELEPGKGVCWTAVNTRQTVIVDDVHKFPGHIACDARSRSEIVVPVYDRDGIIIAVLDIDSTRLANFDEIDAAGIETLLKMING